MSKPVTRAGGGTSESCKIPAWEGEAPSEPIYFGADGGCKPGRFDFVEAVAAPSRLRIDLLQRGAFTLFEVMITLAVFALATLGIVQAVDGTLHAALAARDRMQMRTALESRLAFCLVEPPLPGSKRVIEPTGPEGLRMEESLQPDEIKNADGEILPSMFKLTVTAGKPDSGEEETETVSILIYHPGPSTTGARP